jgi:hypothetical protein
MCWPDMAAWRRSSIRLRWTATSARGVRQTGPLRTGIVWAPYDQSANTDLPSMPMFCSTLGRRCTRMRCQSHSTPQSRTTYGNFSSVRHSSAVSKCPEAESTERTAHPPVGLKATDQQSWRTGVTDGGRHPSPARISEGFV